MMVRHLLGWLLLLVLACGGETPTTVDGGSDTGTSNQLTTPPTDGGGDLGGASGDCETDIAALEPIIEEERLLSNLTAEEVSHASSLISSIAAFCSDEVADEFFARPEVDEFMSG